MSTYRFLISKNNIARDSDPHITYDDPNGHEDVTVTLWVNDIEIHAVTLTDEGACLEYNGTLAEGYHTVKIQSEAGKPTDIRIDRVLIDDNIVVGSQYKIDTRIFGSSKDFMPQTVCEPFRANKDSDHVWWGQVYNADYTVVANTILYRPHVVTDLGQWWQWSFSITASGHVHWMHDESDMITYDSTENCCWYAAKSRAVPTVDWNADFMQNDDSSSGPQWAGPGSYDENFRWINDDITMVDYDHTSFLSETEYKNAYWYSVYYTYSNVDPIVVS